MNDEITFRSDVPVEFLDGMGDDRSIIRAMFVSSDKLESVDDMEESAVFGRINALMRDRHGTPFEHGAFSFYSEAPIFVYREWHRHRIGVSINEQSGRYSELPPMFYIPPRERPLVKKPGSKQMDYELVPGSPEQRLLLGAVIEENSRESYRRYQTLLEQGIVKEVARMVLPVNIYSKMIWTANPRSIMSFLSLRTRRPAYWEKSAVEVDGDQYFWTVPGGAKFPSKPQWEINVAADAIEEIFKSRFPLTWRAFEENGRVAP